MRSAVTQQRIEQNREMNEIAHCLNDQERENESGREIETGTVGDAELVEADVEAEYVVENNCGWRDCLWHKRQYQRRDRQGDSKTVSAIQIQHGAEASVAVQQAYGRAPEWTKEPRWAEPY